MVAVAVAVDIYVVLSRCNCGLSFWLPLMPFKYNYGLKCLGIRCKSYTGVFTQLHPIQYI